MMSKRMFKHKAWDFALNFYFVLTFSAMLVVTVREALSLEETHVFGKRVKVRESLSIILELYKERKKSKFN